MQSTECVVSISNCTARCSRSLSDRQWRGILRILVVQGKRLDVRYALESAAEIGVEDLKKALDEAGSAA